MPNPAKTPVHGPAMTGRLVDRRRWRRESRALIPVALHSLRPAFMHIDRPDLRTQARKWHRGAVPKMPANLRIKDLHFESLVPTGCEVTPA